jgi:5-methylcytosine-specific restriction endonuclease McrA
VANKRTQRGGSGRRSGSAWIPRWRRLALYLRDGFRCAYCGRDLRGATPHQITLDHLVCVAVGGGHEDGNLVTACLSCNSQRGARAWYLYATGGAKVRIRNLRRRKLNAALAQSLTRGKGAPVIVLAREAGF